MGSPVLSKDILESSCSVRSGDHPEFLLVTRNLGFVGFDFELDGHSLVLERTILGLGSLLFEQTDTGSLDLTGTFAKSRFCFLESFVRILESGSNRNVAPQPTRGG